MCACMRALVGGWAGGLAGGTEWVRGCGAGGV